jgi:hypothetical protein
MFGFSTVGSVGLMVFLLVPISGLCAALYLALALRNNARRRESRP